MSGCAPDGSNIIEEWRNAVPFLLEGRMKKCICEWCKRTQNRSGKGYCRKHYDQIRKYGHIKDERTSRDDNRIIIKSDYAEIVVTDSKDNVQGIAKISIEDIEKIKGHHWSNNGYGYVRCFVGTSPLYLHRYIMDCPEDMEVDHINHDRMDNRRNNLRIVSHEINARNNIGECIRKITDRKLIKPYFLKINKNGKIYFSKYFRTYEEAVNVRNEIRKELAELK